MTDFEYLFRREHSVYSKNKTLWQRSSQAYSGGASYIEQALIKHVSEIDLDFSNAAREHTTSITHAKSLV